jgi:dihydrofolate reductase
VTQPLTEPVTELVTELVTEPGGRPAAVALIWAEAAGGVIGRDGALPWHLPEDLAHFRGTTRGATVLMGRRTWESLPARFRPLPGRRNLVLTRDPCWSDAGAQAVGSLPAALAASSGPVWVIGGAQAYRAAIRYATRAVRTEVELTVTGDVYAPDLDADWRRVPADPDPGWLTSRTGLRYRITYWERPSHKCDPDHTSR